MRVLLLLSLVVLSVYAGRPVRRHNFNPKIDSDTICGLVTNQPKKRLWVYEFNPSNTRVGGLYHNIDPKNIRTMVTYGKDLYPLHYWTSQASTLYIRKGCAAYTFDLHGLKGALQGPYLGTGLSGAAYTVHGFSSYICRCG